MPLLDEAIKEGSKSMILYNVVLDLKLALKPALYDELIGNSFYYAPPYFPLFGFMVQFKKWPLLSLSVMEMQNSKLRQEFNHYTAQHFSSQDILTVVDKWCST